MNDTADAHIDGAVPATAGPLSLLRRRDASRSSSASSSAPAYSGRRRSWPASPATSAGCSSLWIAGGVISLIGALCYAELATTYPHAGGDYHFLTRAYGRNVSFLYAWARATVINTGSIALLAFVFGDYMSRSCHSAITRPRCGRRSWWWC